MMRRAVLPWPPAALNPNARVHWSEKARAAKKHKADCQLACMASDLRGLFWPRMHVRLTFCPPSKHRRDDDNLIAAMKAGCDGIAAAACVDDSKWTLHHQRGEPCKNGAVIVEVWQDTPPQEAMP